MSQRALSEELKNKIRKDLMDTNLSQRNIAEKYGVSQGAVSAINGGIKKHHVPKRKPKAPEAPDPTNKRILQLEAQNLALKDEISRCSQAYKAAQRDNSIFEALVDELHQTVTPLKAPKPVRVKTSRKTINETVVAMLSDEHADSVIIPEQVGNLERYNFPIALRRAEEYVDTVIQYTQSTLNRYKFKRLCILAIGDHSSGEIHGAKMHSEYRNQFRNSLAIGQMHALMFRDLAPHFESIDVLYLSGNHGRRSKKKDFHGARDNWDYLIAEIARMHCGNIENINFLIPDSFSACLDIEGWGFGASHGDEVRAWNGIPWYGIERRTRRLGALSALRDHRIHYYTFAHFHNMATQATLDGETIINGAWPATDPYSYEGLAIYSEPSQWLFGVHHKRGVSWRLNIRLKTSREHLGPNRYQVSLAQ